MFISKNLGTQNYYSLKNDPHTIVELKSKKEKMTNEEHINEFLLLKQNLFNNLAIYHERITVLVEITKFEIRESGVSFKAKIVKPLNRNHAENHYLYKLMMSKNEISFNASYQFGKDSSTPLVKNKKIGRPYCPFLLWLDPDLVKFVFENDDEITKEITNLLIWNEDWKILKNEQSIKDNDNKKIS